MACLCGGARRRRGHWSRRRVQAGRKVFTPPAVAEQRLSLTPGGHMRYQVKTPYKNGTTHVLFEPLDFLARLAALVPKPR